MRQIALFKEIFFGGNMLPNPLAICFKTPKFPKNYTLILEYGFTRVTYALDLCRQCDYHYFFADNVITFTLLMCCY